MAKNPKKQNQLMKNEELLDRTKEILLTIVKIYLETGEPVGSRTLSKKLDVTLSPATIRNEMSDLEELGYIIKPHASAGRIPSDKGYRFYVNRLISEKEVEIKSLKTEMNNRVEKLEDMMKTLIKNISSNTNYATMIKGPSTSICKIKFAQVSNLEEKKLLVVTVAESNIIKHSIVDIDSIIEPDELIDISTSLNQVLSGTRICDLDSDSFNQNFNKVKADKEVLKNIIKAVKVSYDDIESENNILTYGSNNFFKYKDFMENENIGNLVETFEEKKDLAKLIDMSHEKADETGINVYIGDESTVKSLKNCSVITANCDFGNGMKGTIGVVGPKRMDYEKVFKTIKNTMLSIGKELK